MTTGLMAPVDLAYIAHLYDRNLTFKNSFSVLNAPALRYSIFGGGEKITLDLKAKQSGGAAAVAGDIIQLTQQGGIHFGAPTYGDVIWGEFVYGGNLESDGSVLYTG